MKLLFSICLSLLFIVSFGQTKKETQDWIKEKIESFSHTNTSGNNSVKFIYMVNFTDCIMTITEKLETYVAGLSQNMTTITKYPIKDLAKPSFGSTITGGTILFRSKTPDNISETILELDQTATRTEKDYNLGKAVSADNLQERLTKAFITLIKLCGGQIPKEAF